jgi:hypothetical protein
MARKPTVIGGSKPKPNTTSGTSAVPAPVSNTSVSQDVIIPENFPIKFDQQQINTIKQKLDSVDFLTISPMEVVTLENEPEKLLHTTLDGFLSNIDKFQDPKLFELITGLNKAVEEQKLPDLADKIIDGKPSLSTKLRGFFNKKALQQAWEDTMKLASGKTKTLVDVVNKMDAELQAEQKKLMEEIMSMEKLREAYGERFVDFSVAVGFMVTFLAKAKKQLEQIERDATGADGTISDPVQRTNIEGHKDKLQALESRTLALEGTLTGLPGNALIIRQIQNAGLSTLQETVTTASSRFASIKMTLLQIHGALQVKSVQRLAQQGKNLDDNLSAVGRRLTKDTVTTAANAAGDNRVAQAEKLKQLAADSRELNTIVHNARETNKEKFSQARAMFAEARDDMAQLEKDVPEVNTGS